MAFLFFLHFTPKNSQIKWLQVSLVPREFSALAMPIFPLAPPFLSVGKGGEKPEVGEETRGLSLEKKLEKDLSIIQ